MSIEYRVVELMRTYLATQYSILVLTNKVIVEKKGNHGDTERTEFHGDY